MEIIFVLLAIQTAAALAAGVYLWRQVRRHSIEIADLRKALSSGVAQRPVAMARRAAKAEVLALAVGAETIASEPTEAPIDRAQRAWSLPPTATITAPPTGVSAETARGLTLGILAIAPALGFAFNASAPTVVACGLAISAAMMAIAHRPIWSAAAWAGVATSGAWALIGLAIGSARTDPASFSTLVALAGVTGLIHAYRRRISTGVTMALIMAIASLVLAAQIGMISPAGVAFGFIVAAAAVTGALSLRLEGLHIGAFVAALVGLFILSGQPSAAIWFTPATAWAGALFFAIAAIRVPQLGARGLAIAGTGALAPLAAVTALYFSQQGLADRFAAAAGFAVVSALLGGVIAAAAMRRDRGLDALKATLWVLLAGSFTAFAASVGLALPAALAAPTFAFAALLLSALDLGLPSRAWRAFACLCSIFAVISAFTTAQVLLGESSLWPAWLLIVSGVGAPALIIGAAAVAAKRRQARLSASFLEGAAIVLAVAAADLVVRVVYAAGAVLLEPISFAELGAHAAVWLSAALFLRMRARFGARRVRVAFANVMLVTTLGVLLTAAALWMTPFWEPRQSPVAFISRDTFGFLLPALMLAGHFWLWRSRGAELQTRLALAGASLMLAAFLTLEVTRSDGDADWLGAIVGALSFAAAIGVNFIPGVARQPQTTSR